MEKHIENKNRESLLQTERRCYICGSTNNIHKHHIFFGTANRKKSDEDLMCIYLCAAHHNMSTFSVHFNKELDIKIKQLAEKVWINTYTEADMSYESKIDKFIERYGKNYLDDSCE